MIDFTAIASGFGSVLAREASGLITAGLSHFERLFGFASGRSAFEAETAELEILRFPAVLGPDSDVLGSDSEVLGQDFEVLGADSWILVPDSGVCVSDSECL